MSKFRPAAAPPAASVYVVQRRKDEILGARVALMHAKLAQQQRRLQRLNDLCKATRCIDSTGLPMPAPAAAKSESNHPSKPPQKHRSGFAEKYLGRNYK